VRHGRRDIHANDGDGAPRGVLARLSYAKVVATLALFVALGGTATAATLARDSVGAPQIKTDAVRSPEIQADAVRSPEIRADAVRGSEIQADAVRSSEIQDDAVRSSEIQDDAVRSSEIQDESVRLADIAPDARTTLEARVRLATTENEAVPTCTLVLTDCPNLLSVVLPADNWLVQATFTMRNNGNPTILGATCGLVQADTTLLESVHVEGLAVRAAVGSTEAAALTAVLTDVPAETRIALRCTEDFDVHLDVDDVVITAVEVGPVTG
jgi:hypothetical protein